MHQHNIHYCVTLKQFHRHSLNHITMWVSSIWSFSRGHAVKHSDGRLCDFCESSPWVGPESERIPQPIPDTKNPPHYNSVFCTPVRNDDGSRRYPDDWQPRAQLKHLFNSSEITLNDTDAIKEYATKFAVDEKYVRSYLEHLTTLRLKESIRSTQRQTDKSKQDLKTYNEYDWLDMSLKGTLQQLTVKELEKYVTAHGLSKYGKKKVTK